MAKKKIWICVNLFVLGIVLAGCNTGALQIQMMPSEKKLKETQIHKDKGLFVFDKIAIVDVRGTLADERQGGLLQIGENPVSTFIENLDKAAKDSQVKAVVLRVDSPGGTVTATEIMYHNLKECKQKTKKPVIVCVTGMACSGAYYLSCASDGIVAQQNSLVGNIGTIMETFSIAGTMQKIGVEEVTIKSGQLKDIGSPFHNLTQPEKDVLEGIIKEMFGEFVAVVREGRKGISEQDMQKLTDGKVFTGQQGLNEDLVDKIGYISDAINWAKEKAGVKKVRVVIYHRPSVYTPNAYSPVSAKANNLESLINIQLPDWLTSGRTQFLYLWKPGIE